MTRIEWTDQTWNPVVGCTPVSSGCANCYAARFASRFGAVWPGVAAHGKWTGKMLLRPEVLDVPLHWRKPRRVFVCSMSDLFHESVPFDFIDRVFAVMALCPQHTFQVLTKRPERAAGYLARGGDGIWSAACDIDLDKVRPETDPGWPLRNVWLGTSCENQETADERIPHLLRCPAAVRFVSCEPLLDHIELETPGPYRQHVGRSLLRPINALTYAAPPISPGIDWVIVGGESGTKARACDVAWIRGIVRQCGDANVPCFVKQLGALPSIAVGADAVRWVKECTAIKLTSTGNGRYFATTAHTKGGEPAEWPEELRVREWPKVTR